MIPRVAATGHSFKGASLYYLHDKQAKTKDRVVWAHTHNLPTNDPDRAFKCMAHTAMSANRLKRQAGVPLTGRKQKAGAVYSFSLAWHPEEDPDKQTMMDAAYETLSRLRLEEHEAVFVAHNDTAHPHVHVICNLVHPENGKKAVLSYDFLTMSHWAEGVERNNGKIYCEQRVLNNEMRRSGKSLTHEFQLVKHKDKELAQKHLIRELYDQAIDGNDFKSKLKLHRYILAQGGRRGFVLVDENEKVFSLARQLKGQRAKDIKKRLRDVDELPHLKDVLHPPVFDRDKYETERQKKIVDSAIQESRKKEHMKKPDPEQQNYYDDSHLLKLDALREWEQKSQQLRHILKEQQKTQYDRKDIYERVQLLDAELKSKKGLNSIVSGKDMSKQLKLHNLKKTLASIDQRIQEQKLSLERKIEKDKPGIARKNYLQKEIDLKRLRGENHDKDAGLDNNLDR